MPALPSQRHLFDIPEDIAYFNCASNAPQLNTSRERLLAGARSKSQPWHRTSRDFFDDADIIRQLAAELFGGDAEGFAVIPAASYGLSTAARAIEPQLRAGDEILLIADEFPSNVLPWKRTAQETGAMITTVPTPEDGDWTAAILARIGATTKVVSVSTCHWTNGAMIDLRPIGQACRDAGIALVVDATQSLGAMPFPLAEIAPDFLVAAGYKWLLCPYGFGLLYVSKRWRQARPLEESWLTRDNAQDFTALANYNEAYRPGARRFDVGETCTPTILPGVIAALTQIQAWGVANIAETLAAVNSRIAQRLQVLGFSVPTEALRCLHMFGAPLPAGCTVNMVAELAKQNIFISQRGHSLRFAPHLHVNDADVTRLLAALSELAG
jgi:selenocysteine lyase/cysteine desulfurase